MTTGYSRDELTELERLLEEKTPFLPTDMDKLTAPRVSGLNAAGTDLGILFAFELKGNRALYLFLNCVVATEMAAAINLGDQAYVWKSRAKASVPGQRIPDPTPEDLNSALSVGSLATYSMPGGAIVNFYVVGGGTTMLLLPVKVALAVRNVIASAGASAGWWDTDFELLARRVVN